MRASKRAVGVVAKAAVPSRSVARERNSARRGEKSLIFDRVATGRVRGLIPGETRVRVQRFPGPSFALLQIGGDAMRNEMIGAVVRRAMEHPEFRRRLIENPQDALQTHGFALEEPEMEIGRAHV